MIEVDDKVAASLGRPTETVTFVYRPRLLVPGLIRRRAPPPIVIVWSWSTLATRPRRTSGRRAGACGPSGPALWPVPVDPLEKEITPPMTLRPSIWRADGLYVQRFVWLQRPGTEACRGYFTPAELTPVRGGPTVDLPALR